MRVWAPTAAEILQLCEVRGVLAGYAARKAAVNLTPEDMEGVRAMLAELESATGRRDVAAFRKLDRGFHDAIYAGAGDHIIRREIAHMHKFVRPYERLAVKLLDESYLGASQDQHRRIVKLLERKSVDELEALVRLHAMNFGQQLARFLGR
jgi:DNA-binding GntR family transcriptional regulator